MAWTFKNLQYGGERDGELMLAWEAAGDFITDDHTPDDTEPQELLQRWLSAVGSREADGALGPEWVPVSWPVTGAEIGSEAAPFAVKHYIPQNSPDFLTYYSWPQDEAGR